MIVKKIGRKAGDNSYQAERRYSTALNRYIVRAGAAEVHALAEVSDDEYIRDLAAYTIRHGATELVRDQWSINLEGETVEDWQAEVDALRFRAGNPPRVTDHWVLSWHEDDEPTDTEIREAVRLFLKCQQLDGCPVIAGCHEDTDNIHVHLCITRLDRITGRRITAGQGWDIDTAHRAKSVIEDRFPHWRQEEGSRYRVISGRLMEVEGWSDVGPADDPSRWQRLPSRKTQVAAAADMKLDEPSHRYERATGLKSLSRVAWEEAVPVLLRSRDWAEAHRELAVQGIELRKTRTGGVLAFGDKTVKPSICRETSFAKLEQHWGPYQQSNIAPVRWRPREIHAADTEHARYYAQKRAFDAQLTAIASQLRSIEKLHGASADLSTLSRKRLLSAYAFPSFADWRTGAAPEDPNQVLQIAASVPSIGLPGAFGGSPTLVDVPGFIAMKRRDVVVYRRLDDPTHVAITDIGSLVLVHDWHNRDVVRAALLIAAKKWPGQPLELTGDPEFVRQATAIAAELKIEIADVEQRIPEPIHRPKESAPTQVVPDSRTRIVRQSADPAPPVASESQASPGSSGKGPQAPESERYREWLKLRRGREQRLEQERLAFLIAQDEAEMRLAQVDGHAAQIIEQAAARCAWLAARAMAAQSRGWGR